MPKRSREEKLAAYSKGAKRGYRARKRMLKMTEPQPGEAGAHNDLPGRKMTLRGVDAPGSGDAAQGTFLDKSTQRDAMVAQPGNTSTAFPQVMDMALRS